MGQVRVNDFNPNGYKEDFDLEIADTGKPEDIVVADDTEEALKARLPLITNPRKANYLANRACGFSVREACNLAGVNQGTVMRWRREDEDFVSWEGRSLMFLQREMVDDILRAEFLRNMRLALNRDGKVLYKSVYNFEGMTPREYEYLKLIRKHYTPSDLLALERAMAPEEGHSKTGSVNVEVHVSGQLVDSDEARRAAARDLLDKFNANGRLAVTEEPGELEGTATIIEGPEDA